MSKDSSNSRFITRSISKNTQSVNNENEFENSLKSVHVPPPKTPQDSNTETSLCQRELQELDFNSQIGSKLTESVDRQTKEFESSDSRLILNRGIGNVGLSYGTPRVSGRGKAHSEPNSVQSTPARSVSRTGIVGALGTCTGPRPPQSGARGGSSSRVSRGITLVHSEFSVEVPHFELVENNSFWKDHNVQVMIRIRPMSDTQRYGRCLRQESAQSLVWLGHPETRFTFDHIACETISQEKLFRVAGLPMVDNCMSGYNSCMFAYGQTGSGKTYTMMGEICQADGKLSEYCGITPRVFEYLFTRIRQEEENGRDERLRYSCKCSFLEIYNEQITDLLEPSSTNLQLREDLKKGVYVENLTECNVRTVDDVIKLLLQGAANRKMAATHMNSESSRSHSVFTCIIESCWEKDSMTHFRFGRLNLVDLAGSERQKSSGAEGDRLKEAANINKSLSTLGLVIMSLVDLAHGKQRHVPYRDSRLTFLLQDSLGGNSKTTIIANVNPSICSANETLSTLKFAQRAKLIQNNAKINEDASGDVTALQQQIQQLKGQLSFLMQHHNMSRSLSCVGASFQQSSFGDYQMEYEFGERNMNDDLSRQCVQKEKIKCLEAIMFGALRREKLAETAVRRLEAQIEQMSHLVHQREEEAQSIKVMLRFREEKIKQLESFSDDLVSADKCLTDENISLKDEIQLLQESIDRNPELTRSALENIRLLEQLRVFQDFYENGERETLLAEVSELRDQLLEKFEGNEGQHKFTSRTQNQEKDAVKELEDCRNMNSKLIRELDKLRSEMKRFVNCNQAAFGSVKDSIKKVPEKFKQMDKYSSGDLAVGQRSFLLAETIPIISDSGDEMTSFYQPVNELLDYKNEQKMGDIDTQNELKDARLLIEALESEQIRLIEELQFTQEKTQSYMESLTDKDKVGSEYALEFANHCTEPGDLENQNQILVRGASQGISTIALQAKLDRMTKELEEAQLLNIQYEVDQASQLSRERQIELVCEQVEVETTKTIIHLQQEVAALQSELQERLCLMAEENMTLRNIAAAKEDEMKALCMVWERATLDLTSFLIDGSKSLKDASSQIESIACSFPHPNGWIGENIEKAAKLCVEKEEAILLLQKSLEDAQKMVVDMELKLNSLMRATVALTEVQQLENDANTKESIQLTTLLRDQINTIELLEHKLKCKEDQITEAEKRADAAFIAVKRLSECPIVSLRKNDERYIPMSKLALCTEVGSHHISDMRANANDLTVEGIEAKVELARLEFSETEHLVNALLPDIEAHNFLNQENQCYMLQQIRDLLAETNGRLNAINGCINTVMNVYGHQDTAKDLEVSGSSVDCSTLGSDLSVENDVLEDRFDATFDVDFKEDIHFHIVKQEAQNSGKLVRRPIYNETTIMELKDEFMMANDAFGKLNVWLPVLFSEEENEDLSHAGICSPKPLTNVNIGKQNILRKALGQLKISETTRALPSVDLMQVAEAGCCDTTELIVDENTSQACIFFTKIEEAHATMKEADFMLNELLKENINAKQLTSMWMRAGKELMVEKASLLEEVEQLRSSILMKDEENALLCDQIHCTFLEIANLVSFLEASFLEMQRDLEQVLKVTCSDALEMVHDMLHCACNSRSLLEDIFAEIMEKGFASFVLYQCQLGKILQNRPSINMAPAFHHSRLHEGYLVMKNLGSSCLNDKNITVVNGGKGKEERDRNSISIRLEEEEPVRSCDSLINENLSLKKELGRKEVLLKGLLFDFSLLQESASSTKDIKDETEKLIAALGEVRHELEMKTSQLDEVVTQYRKLEISLADAETALSVSHSDLEEVRRTVDILSDENAELRMLLKDLYLQKFETDEQLEEKIEVVKSLEKEILLLTSSADKTLLSSIEDIENDLRKLTGEGDQLHQQVGSLQDKLDMACALADENEAIAVEARQESETSKIYAEQKEEEVKILEYSVEELECTINVLEKKVYEMEVEVERHQLIRDSLEMELQDLRQRMLTVENFTENMDSESSNVEQCEGQLSRQVHDKSLELHEAYSRITVLEEERAEQAKLIKQCQEYISELVVLSEAQALQYQREYKSLEAMVQEVKTDPSTLTSTIPALDKTEKNSTRARGSGSPFRCIAGLVQQMNLENGQELSMARLRIGELETLAANRQKEVCMLTTRLAAAESMTHDVIRDLLGVKLDMTNYTNLIDQYQLQKFVEGAQQQAQESIAMEQEILNLRKRISELIEERERCILDVSRREADILAVEMTVQQLKDRDQLLTAQNEMLKKEKTNLNRRIAEFDEMVRKLLGAPNAQPRVRQQLGMKENNFLRLKADLDKRLSHSEKRLSQVNDELTQYRKSQGSHARDENGRTWHKKKNQECD